MSRIMRKPTICICENKDANQLRGNRELILNLKIFALSVMSNDKKYTVITQVDKSTVM